jgi:hypothetical protein
MKKMLSIVSTIVLSTSLLLSGVNAAPAKVDEGSSAALKVANDYYSNIVTSSADGHDGVPLENFTVTLVDDSDLNDIKLSVELTYSGLDTFPSTPVSVVKEAGEYLVKKEVVAYNINPSSPEYGTVIEGETYIDDQPISSGGFGTSAVINGSYYYNDVYANNAGPNSYATVYFTGRAFNNTKTSLTLNGWQEKRSGQGQIGLTYGIATTLAGGSIGELRVGGTPFIGEYAENGTWLTQYFTNVPTGSNRYVFVRNAANSSAFVSGNVYE